MEDLKMYWDKAMFHFFTKIWTPLDAYVYGQYTKSMDRIFDSHLGLNQFKPIVE